MERDRAQADTPASQQSQWIRKELQRWQKEDESLKPVQREVRDQSSLLGSELYIKSRLIYRLWAPLSRDEDMGVEQLVLPTQCRATVLKLAHSIPMTGHLGKIKTASQILQRFYWPTMFKDVGTYCKSCTECRKHHMGESIRTLDVYANSAATFHHNAMDTVGPLPRSRRGHRYILTECNYATRTLKHGHFVP